MVSTFKLDLGLRRSIGVARRWICNHFIYSAIKYSDIKFVIVKLIIWIYDTFDHKLYSDTCDN